ncbi:MAG TPA: DNA polymerase III subunit alpha [Candidatus Hydrogenedentes bacterium]|nr:DNA polymerase III subunit alpha [Candidatus Hydrogenedentota bacterium]HOL75550.1 DNA polymerase III subunit alpha [Candidatus Hydrogenedentota bacterium]HPO86008.1 DNA polymerase III subunit alpha [Candidatus Hydrogenedentota bacterium]
MVHLHVHSIFSFLEGTATIEALIQKCLEKGMRAIALTDTDGLYGVLPFYRAARSAGIHPIIGVELDNVVLLAKNQKGYTTLCRIVTAYQLEKNSTHPLSDDLPNWLTEINSHVFVLTDNLHLIRKMLARGISPLVALTCYGDIASRRRAQFLNDFSTHHGLTAVAVNPIYFLEPSHFQIYQVLNAIRKNTTLDLSASSADRQKRFFTKEEMKQFFRDFPEALKNTENIAEQCELELNTNKIHFPHCEVPKGETPASYLNALVERGIREKYSKQTPTVQKRVRMELEIIHRMGFAPYFLIVADIVEYAHRHNIPIVGRGSAANSIVAYALGITQVDPIRYDLYFERFLNPYRSDCPDIDLDICWRRRDEIIDYVYRRYGADRVAMIATFNTFKARAALRETAKVLGFSQTEISHVVSRIPHYHAKDIRTLIQRLPECRDISMGNEPLKSAIEIAEFIDGFPRHLSIHAGGLVIAPETLTHFVPLQRAAKGIVITQYDMEGIEALGLVKMDLLGHRSLTVIHDTVQHISKNYGIHIDLDRLPDPDPLTAELLRSGNTVGCFQIESPAMRALLQNTQANDTDMLIKTLSLIRPGPSGSGMKKYFIARHLGKEKVEYLHPSLQKVLKDTYGVMLYQEDILKVANAIAGISLAEADSLRRSITKKGDLKEFAAFMKLFIKKAQEQGVAKQTAERIWELIANFAKYSYCKAHACTYGKLAYQCAYLKAHFPAEFFASVLSNRGGFYHIPVYIEEAKRMGVELLPPDINRSDYMYTVENGAIRTGLLEIRDLSRQTIRNILKKRNEAAFSSLTDLCLRTALSYEEAQALIDSGACDGLSCPRPRLNWELRVFFRHKSVRENSQQFYLSSQNHLIRKPPFSVPNYPRRKRVEQEWSMLDFLLKTHPLEYFLPFSKPSSLVSSRDLPLYAGKHITVVGWLIAERRVGVPNHGVMKFLTFEDVDGIFEAVLFSDTYQRYGCLLNSQGPYYLCGKVQLIDHYAALIIDKLENLGESKKSYDLSDITPPLNWMFPHNANCRLIQAD